MQRQGSRAGKTGKILLYFVFCILLSVASVVFYFLIPCFESEACVLGVIDLKTRDQDEGWGNGVSNTWSALNMAPGREYALEGSFVLLRQFGLLEADHLEISVLYALERPAGSTPVTADSMARTIVLTRLEYGNEDWRIDLLRGSSMGRPPCPSGFRPGDWTVSDADGDGKVTFHDLWLDPVDDLPPPQYWMGDRKSPYMRMSVRFDESAGNEFMGVGLKVDFVYELNMWSCL